jgi:hypothetical protein
MAWLVAQDCHSLIVFCAFYCRLAPASPSFSIFHAMQPNHIAVGRFDNSATKLIPRFNKGRSGWNTGSPAVEIQPDTPDPGTTPARFRIGHLTSGPCFRAIEVGSGCAAPARIRRRPRLRCPDREQVPQLDHDRHPGEDCRAPSRDLCGNAAAGAVLLTGHTACRKVHISVFGWTRQLARARRSPGNRTQSTCHQVSPLPIVCGRGLCRLG